MPGTEALPDNLRYSQEGAQSKTNPSPPLLKGILNHFTLANSRNSKAETGECQAAETSYEYPAQLDKTIPLPLQSHHILSVLQFVFFFLNFFSTR